ncbi:sugar phosphate nucleotidyltransferase [Thermodesulfobacteriota bacterium]
MKSVILAGGKGTRLAPYTTVFPKPLVPVGEMPILEIIIRQLAAAGFTGVTLSIGYLGELIRAFFATHKKLSGLLDIQFVHEDEPMGTAGSLTMIPDLDTTFLVMNGDVLSTIDLNKLIAFHKDQKAALTIAGYQKKVNIDLGVLELDSTGEVVKGYIEKPEKIYPVSMGIYIYEPDAVQYIPQNQYFDFPDLVLKLIENGKKVACFQNNDIWLDVGRADDYAHAQDIFDKHREEFRLAE